MKYFIAILGTLDVIVGLIVYTGTSFLPHGLLYAIAMIYIGKGLWSFFTSILASYFYDWMGALDFFAGLSLYLAMSGIILGLNTWLGAFMILKGLYCLLFCF